MSKTNKALVGLLVLQLILAALLLWPRPVATGPASAPLLGGIKADDIVALTVYDAQANSIKLARQGANWTLPEAGDYPADAGKITPVLAKLAELKQDRLVTKTAASQKRLQVADDAFQRKVEIQTSGGANRTLFVGSPGGGRASHVRTGGQNEVYLASDLMPYEIGPDASSWIAPAYYNLPLADVTSLTLANANGQQSFTKDAQGKWSMAGLAAGETFDADGFSALLGQAISMQMTRPLGKSDQAAWGLAQPAAMLTLKTRAGDQEKNYTLAVGANDAKDNSYVAKWSDSPYYVRVAEYAVKDLVEKPRGGFMKPPAAPAPTAPLPQPPTPGA